MKNIMVVITLLWLGASAFGQAVYLKVTTLETRSETKSYEKGIVTGYGAAGSFRKTTEREEVFNVTLRNMAPAAYDYTVEWMFLASPIGGGKIEPFHAEEKKVSLDKNATSSFEISSPKLESTQTHYSFHAGGTSFKGMKFAGYVVRVKIDGKILAVESTDGTLKRQFQDPKARWGLPEIPDAAKKKGNQ